MLTLLIRIFVKNKEDVKNPAVREKYGIVCGGYGIFLNILLFIGKFIAGTLSASIAITADAFNNLSDAGSSLISLIGFHLAGLKPDPEHPYGHGRIEYLSGLVVSALIIIMGWELIKDSFLKILHPEEITCSALTIIILVASILVKVYMAFYNRSVGKKIDSTTLLATATDSLSDTISTFVVLAATIIAHFTGAKIDGYCGLLVGGFVIFAGLSAAKETVSPLLGEPPTQEFIDEVESIVMAHDEIVGIHDLVVHDYGPGRVMITLHAEVPSDGDILELHDVIDQAEYELGHVLNCHATIHMDPVAVGDVRVDELKEKVANVIRDTEGLISFHDFRVVFGTTHTNLIFDVVASFGLKLSDEEIKNIIMERVHTIDKTLICVITVDRDYTGR